MTRLFTFILLCFCIDSSVLGQSYQFQKVNLPSNIREIVSLDNVLFAISDQNLFKSTDFGNIWDSVAIKLSTGSLLSIDSDMGNLYLGTGRGVIVSSDSGKTFTWSYNWDWNATLDVDFHNGIGWSAINMWGSLSGPNRKLIDGTWQLRRGNGIPWGDMSCNQIFTDWIDPANIAFVRGYSTWYVTKNGGDLWTSVADIKYVTAINNVSYIFSANKYTNDYGANWIQNSINGNAYLKNNYAEEVFYGSTAGGIYAWTPHSNILLGLPNQQVLSIAQIEDYLFALDDIGNLIRLVIPTSSWSVKQTGTVLEIAYGSGTDFPQYAALHLNDSYFRMNCGNSSGWGTSVILLPSFWSAGTLHQGAPITTTWKIDGVDIIISFSAAISGLNATGQLRITPPSGNSISASVALNLTGNVVLDNKPGEAFKPVMLSSMHISSDKWDAQTAYVDLQSYQIPQSGWIIQPAAAGKVFGLKGGTSSWKNNAPTVEITFDKDIKVTGWVTSSVDPNDDNVGFWAASDQIIPSWNYTITAKQDHSPVSAENELLIPTAFKLEQNYPNPFNPSTRISFTLAQTGFTILTVFNVLGQKVANLVSKELASGRHEYSFDASNLSSGIYFYKIQAGRFSQIKKMLLMK